MDTSKEKKMQLLLKQINLSEEIIEQFFQKSLLHKLEVYRQDKTWNFHIEVQGMIPLKIYQIFSNQLQVAFQEIATVDFQWIIQNKDSIKDKDILAYWQYFIQTKSDLLPAQRNFIREQEPIIEENVIKVVTGTEAEARSIKRRVEEPFQQFCQKIGLPHQTIEVSIEENASNIKKLKEANEIEDREFAIKMVQEQKRREENNNQRQQKFQIGSPIPDEPVFMEEIQEEERKSTVQGYIFSVEIRKLRSGRSLLILKATDYTDSLEIKMFSRNEEYEEIFTLVKEGMWVKASGRIQTDLYTNELTMMANQIHEIKVEKRQDDAEEKRIELHAHTTMSQLDAVVSPSDLIERAASWGHKAIAITDHAAVQAFPEALAASHEHHIKVLYGVEANVVDDGIPIAMNEQDILLDEGTYIVFDVETTGLSAVYDTIIELAAVKISDGKEIDRFESFANPHRPLPEVIIDITGITDDMLVDAPEVDVVLKDFHEWMGDCILVAHNASFDIGFLNQGFAKIGIEKISNPIIDTLELARFLLPQLGNHRLNTLCNHMDVELTQHHRAIYDAEATGKLFWKFIEMLLEQEITNHLRLNDHMGEGNAYQHGRPNHCVLLAQTEEGLKNLYKLVSKSHIDYFYRVPRMPRSLLQKYRKGILVGSACDQGEVFEAVMQQSDEEAEDIIDFYDYLEVQPPENYVQLLDRELVKNEAQILDIIKNIVALGEKLGKPVVATGNVHYLDDHEKLYRKILMASQKGNPLNRETMPDTPFRTTNEMLACFAFLGEEKAKEIVISNTNAIEAMIDEIKPLKEDLYTPNIEGADEEVRQLTYKNAREMYGESLPKIVKDRLEIELQSIIGHGFAVIYLISYQLVRQSLMDGYLVGSRGSVGSSLVATMMEITEVNPLPPHYVCPECHESKFIDDGSFASGFDLPDRQCSTCQVAFIKDGQDIPFETFLGFEGDKVPDIDLNFSGEYQPKAHHYTRELFGEDKVFRAGTIGTIAERTAFGYVKGYASDHQIHYKRAELDRLIQGCTGVKRTTGQHPGGMIVVPEDKDIYDFTPIQYPADDRESEWLTTHFDFDSIEENLLKLDILGHDDPTVIRMLQDLSGIDPQTLPIGDEEVMKIFSSPESLGVTAEQIECQTGTLGVPEFGTQFVRQMLEETKPSSFAELVIISGLSHGTDVWLGNAQELINDGICEISEVIGCRDDIMVYLMQKGVESSLAFDIMESVRRGRGLTDEWIEKMKEKGVPNWYIESCQKIKYMFPKAHAAAYVLMAVRIAYFKVHHPIFFYAAYFSIRARDFELETMLQGADAVRNRIHEIQAKENDASPKEKNLLTVLQVTLEMYERGFSFQSIDLYRSKATEFIVEEDTLIPPFHAVDSLGVNAANKIVEVREEGEFLSKEDLRKRSRISKTVLESLDRLGCLEGMPEENQLSLF